MGNNIVGSKIKILCADKNMSRDELAIRSGLTADQIERIENSRIVPSLSPLIKIARALGVRFGTFLDDSNELGPVVTRHSESR